ncbi:MAG: bis(5'-nucleosyl)-tetraphosphatase [Acetanaerobacterium sp.]
MTSYEKSCGALVYRCINGQPELLLIRHKAGGHWSFPKGHVEAGETEQDTALREVREETGLIIALKDGFRESVCYRPRPDISKTVVYFIGMKVSGELRAQEEEVADIAWVPFSQAGEQLTYSNDRRLLSLAQQHLSPPL